MIRRGAASLPLTVVLLEVTAVAVLAPDIRLDLGSSSSGAQWVLNAYLLALAALLPIFARLRDGRLPAAAGAVALAAGSIVCATADATSTLVAGRGLQGAGAAALLGAPVVASAALPAVALAIGPLVGGVLAEQNWWHLYFWAGVPLAAAAGLGALAAQRAEPVEPANPLRLAAHALGLAALTTALVQGEVWPWGWAALLALAGAVLLRLAWPSEAPIGALTCAALAAALTALLFLMPQYLQLARNLSGSRSGILLLAMTLSAVVAWALSPWFERRVSARARMALGAIALAGGLAILGTIDSHTRYALLIGALGLSGGGLGLIAGSVPAIPAMPASAGAALGLAGAGSAFQLAQADARDSGGSFEHALAVGVGWAAVFLLALLVCVGWFEWRRATPGSSAARPAAES